MITNEKNKEAKNSITSVHNILFASTGDLSGEVDLIWNPAAGASGYVIEVSKMTEKENWKQVDIVTKSHYTVSGLRAGNQYKFRIAPLSRQGQHKWSKTVTQKAG